VSGRPAPRRVRAVSRWRFSTNFHISVSTREIELSANGKPPEAFERKRNPTDFDGIGAGAPPNPSVNFNAEQLWRGWLTKKNPALQMPASKFVMLNSAVFKACASSIRQKQGVARAHIDQVNAAFVAVRYHGASFSCVAGTVGGAGAAVAALVV